MLWFVGCERTQVQRWMAGKQNSVMIITTKGREFAMKIDASTGHEMHRGHKQ